MSEKKEVIIPKQLCKEGFRFLKLQKKKKKPTADMKKWQAKNDGFMDTDLLNHIADGGNYGVIGGYNNLIIIDADSEEVNDICEELPETLTIKTGAKENYKKHYYFITYLPLKPVRLSKTRVGDLGDIRSKGQYVVGANSIHPSGNKYKIAKDKPIAKITRGKILTAFKDVINKNETTKFSKKDFKPDTKLRSSKYIKECKVPDYCRENKLKSNTAKNWKLFPYIVDILHNRQSSIEVYKEILKKQGHSPGAIKGWIDYVRKGKLMKTSCKKMRGYLEQYHPEKIDEICGNCPIYKKIKERKKIETSKTLTEFQKDILIDLNLGDKGKATEKIVNLIESKNHIYTTRDDQQSEMWIYKKGVYKPEGKSYVKEICRKILETAYTSHLYKRVLDKIEADTYIEQDDFFQQEYKTEIPVQNGVLDIIKKELKPFTPEKIFFNKLPVEFKPEAKCPAIDNHFDDVLKEKDDKKVLYEIIGFLLYKDYFFEKVFMFVGNGRNGKGKTIDLIKRFIGVENSASIPLVSLNQNSFRVSELFGKMVNLAGDLSKTSLKETGMLKMTTGRDLIGAKRKFKTDIKFMNYAKHIFACNELPIVYDTSKGFWSRWMVFEFPYEFIDKKVYETLNEGEKKDKKIKDPNHIDKISTQEELNGLLNKALEGLKRILENKSFSYSKGTEEVKSFWIRKSDSFTAFCLDNLKESDNGRISKKDLRKAYHKYCKKHNVEGTSDKAMKITLEKMFGVTDIREYSSESGKTERLWVGLKWRENSNYKYVGGR